jgi:hypothetical protein
MTWYAVYRKADGGICSLGTVLGESLAAEYAVKELTGRPDLSKVAWDAASLEFVAIPPEPPDPVKEAVASLADLDVSTLTQAQLIALMVKALKFLVKRELSRG